MKRELLWMVLLTGLYALSAKLGLAFAFLGANISPLWPPTGVAISALLLGGLRLWPGVLLGAFLANAVLSPLPIGIASVIALGNCTEALVAASILKHLLKFRPTFERTSDTLGWMAIAGGFAPLFGATIGTVALAGAEVLPWSNLGSAWWTWWSGDAVGALVLAPPILVWSQRPWKNWTIDDQHTGLQIFVFLLTLSLLVFFTPVALDTYLSPLAFVTLPPLLWAAFKLGPPGATLASLLVCSIAIAGTATGHGAYSGFKELNQKMGLLQGYLAVASMSAIGFAGLVSERQRAEERSLHTEERFRLLVEAVKDYAIILLDPEGRVVTWNEGAERITGFRANEIIGQHIRRIYPEEDTAAGRPEFVLGETTRNGRFTEEGWRVRKDGSQFYANVVLTSLWNSDATLRGFVKITRDVTERRDLLQRLKAHQQDMERLVQTRTSQLGEAQRTLRLIYDSVQDPMGLVSVEPGGQFIIASCNKPMAVLRGNHPRQLVGRRLDEVLGKELAGKVLPLLREVARSVEAKRVEWCIPTLAGERIYDAQIRPLSNEEGACAHLLVCGQDVTERLKSESALRESQKLESLGVMAGGIAHDFNNLLTSVLGYANIGASTLPSNSPATPLFQKIERSALRAADLTQQLLAYAGRGQFLVTDVDLNVIILEITQLLSVSISKKAELRFNLHRPLPLVQGDATQMQQLIMNLALNASEALEGNDDGVIVIRTTLEFLDEKEALDLQPSLHTKPGHYVACEIIDSGSGMPPEIQARIFDPFFTTKFLGRGLGLPAMLGILRSHHGGIRVRSEVGQGSSFKIYLPALPIIDGTRRAIPEDEHWEAQGTLLLVDDEPALLDLAGQMAEEMGFKVIQAKDGVEALERFRLHQGELALVLMDLTMPNMGGREAVQRMRRMDPSVPILLSSGYSEQDVGDLLSDPGLAGFLKKPYRTPEFRAAVRRALQGSTLYKVTHL